MSTTKRNVKFSLKILNVLRVVTLCIVRFILKLYYGTEGQKIPAIKERIIKEPAMKLAKKIRDREVSSVELLEAYIRRIKEVNPTLNCFVENRFEAALKEAREADEAIRAGTKTAEQLAKEKPLLGVPFTTKDCIAVKGLHQTAGVTLRKDFIAEKDAETIRLLREKGAIIIGLTNVPELCMWWESHNHIYGRTNNPYNTTRIVGGSSGGEGCLQAVAGSAFGIGSDIGGSIRMPAFFNGIFGHKPTRYAVSNEGQYPEPHSEMQNSFLGIGPMTRYASDLKPLLNIIAGSNSAKLKLDDPVDITKLKVYYQYDNEAPLVDRVDPDIVNALNKVVNYVTTKLETRPEEVHIEQLFKSNPIWLATMKNETSFGQLIMGKDDTCSICLEILKNTIGFSGNTMIGLFTALFDKGGVEIGSETHKRYIRAKDELEKTFKTMLGENGVFLYPTHPTPAPYHDEPLFRPLNFCYTSIINCLGFPATNIPLGLGREGLPIGIQVIANHDNDRLCLAIAEELDKVFGGWVEPHST